MRERFIKKLTELNHQLIQMGALIENAISNATKSLVLHDIPLAKATIANDQVINTQEREIESTCLKLIVHEQPIAKDLRFISAALKMITDMERIGDHAADISEIVVMMEHTPYNGHLEHIPQMAKATIKMVNDSIDAYVKKDLTLASVVIKADDEVDALFTIVRTDLINLIHEDKNNGEQAFDLLMIAKYLERIGDHAVNIAEWVVFSITGIHKNTRIM